MTKKSMLIILDGWGLGPNRKVDAIAQASTPFFDHLMANYPHGTLVTHGEQVGLPDGQMGNSEVGHLNLGAGRIVYQELARINKALIDGELAQNIVLKKGIEYAIQHNKAFHLMGLISDGGVHSHQRHLIGLCQIIADAGVKKIYVHGFTDGRDVDPKSGISFVRELNESLPPQAKLVSVVGRYYAMDRDKRWERTRKAYDLIVHGKGTAVTHFEDEITKSYAEGTTDEFLMPMYLANEEGPIGRIQPDDAICFFNFRTDRPRQLTTVLTQTDLPEFGMQTMPLHYITMTRYDESYKGLHIMFEKDNLQKTMGEIVSENGLTQVRIAETEKYPHVTFFFSGGREDTFKGEDRIMVPSPKVATYDLQPEMSAFGVTDKIVEKINTDAPDFVCLNYANTDMVGHTGDFNAAMKAAETVDFCLSKLIPTALEHQYSTIIIADHGNSDYMINDDGTPNTAHSKSPVPCILVGPDRKAYEIKDGKLADIAPTLLTLMGIDIPKQMTGEVLVRRKD
jgi:2,3-bisphosphoglycerate-independent phosphoglycerate mutase